MDGFKKIFFFFFSVIFCFSLSARYLFSENQVSTEISDSAASAVPKHNFWQGFKKFFGFGTARRNSEFLENINLRDLSDKFLSRYKEYSTKHKDLDEKIKPVLLLQEFEQMIDLFIETFSKNEAIGFTQKNNWIDSIVPSSNLIKNYKLKELKYRCPYAQKLSLEPGTKIDVTGDIHASLHSLLRNFWRSIFDGKIGEDLVLKGEKNYRIFLGDYVDRGRYSVEVLFLMMALKLKNPDKVFLLRGNHEDPNLGWRGGLYTIRDEIKDKYGDNKNSRRIINKLSCVYDLMPFVLYVGCNGTFVQFCHGGIDPSYDPCKLLTTSNVQYELLLGKKEKSQFLDDEIRDSALAFFRDVEKVAVGKKSDFYAIGLSWCDIATYKNLAGLIITNPNKILFSNHGYSVSLEIIEKYFNELNKKLQSNNVQVKGLVRGHQHTSFSVMLFDKKHKVEEGQDFDWTKLIDKQDLIDSLGFSMSSCFPVFTLISAPEGVGNGVVRGIQVNFNKDSFSTITVGGSWDKWYLKPNEFPIQQRNENGIYCSIGLDDLNKDKGENAPKIYFSAKPKYIPLKTRFGWFFSKCCKILN